MTIDNAGRYLRFLVCVLPHAVVQLVDREQLGIYPVKINGRGFDLVALLGLYELQMIDRDRFDLGLGVLTGQRRRLAIVVAVVLGKVRVGPGAFRLGDIRTATRAE